MTSSGRSSGGLQWRSSWAGKSAGSNFGSPEVNFRQLLGTVVSDPAQHSTGLSTSGIRRLSSQPRGPGTLKVDVQARAPGPEHVAGLGGFRVRVNVSGPWQLEVLCLFFCVDTTALISESHARFVITFVLFNFEFKLGRQSLTPNFIQTPPMGLVTRTLDFRVCATD